MTATALSGTPADAAKASANPGQSVKLNGSGLTTATDVLLRYTDYNGSAAMVRLSPTAAAADGTSATLVIPDYANGAFALQLFGSATQPLLQIVPVLASYDENGTMYLYGAGFVEGATRYDFRERRQRHGGQRRGGRELLLRQRPGRVHLQRRGHAERRRAAALRAGQGDGHHRRRHLGGTGAQRAAPGSDTRPPARSATWRSTPAAARCG